MFDGEAIAGADEQKRTRTRKRTIHFGVGDMKLRPGELARFDRATGVRPEKRRREETVVPNDSERCTKRACDCAAVRAEREELLLQRDELLLEAAAHRQLHEQLRELAIHSAAGDSSAALGSSVLQQALLEILEGEEEAEEKETGSDGRAPEIAAQEDQEAAEDASKDEAEEEVCPWPCT